MTLSGHLSHRFEEVVPRGVRLAWEETVQVGLVVPLQGPAGMFGPSCDASARLAVEEINARAGILGRQVRLVPIDGARPPQQVADEVDALVSAGAIDAVTGWHISAVRQAIAPRTLGRVPYVYTALYEGGERTPGVFLTGETPDRQLLPAMRWMLQELGVQRWFIVGDNYVWPRGSALAAHDYARSLGLTICGDTYVPLGAEDYSGALRAIERSEPDGVLMFLVGADAAQFNRAFAGQGLHESIFRLSTLMDENILLATGPDGTSGLYGAAAFFETLPTPGSLQFHQAYTHRYGALAPVLNSMGESCYEGLRLLAALWERAGALDMNAVCRQAEQTGYDGPRGCVHLRGRHLRQPVYIARAESLCSSRCSPSSHPDASSDQSGR